MRRQKPDLQRSVGSWLLSRHNSKISLESRPFDPNQAGEEALHVLAALTLF